MLEFINVSKKYKKITAIDDLSLTIAPGEFVFLVGPNGAGKSTLLELISCEERPSSGTIMFDGVNLSKIRAYRVPHIRRKMGIIFQDYRLLQNRTVEENIAFAMRVLGHKRSRVKERVEEVLEIVGMTERRKNYPPQLSGGEQQRTAIGRALVNSPMLFMADEPTGNLDPQITLEIMQLFMDINAQGTTIIMATHDMDIVRRLQQRVIALDRGRLVKDYEKGGYPL